MQILTYRRIVTQPLISLLNSIHAVVNIDKHDLNKKTTFEFFFNTQKEKKDLSKF